MHVAHRHPVQLAVVAVDRAAQALQLVQDVRVGADVLAAGRRDLDQRGAAPS
mgnify:CR=1 FL=1